MTGTSDFIRDYREAFGEKAPLPILFYYSDTPVASPENTNGCMFKLLVKAKQGQNITLSKDTVTCGGGRHYAGFAPLQERVYTFVSEKERYKATPKDVAEYVAKLDVQLTDKKYLNFVRIDHAVSFDNMEGLLFSPIQTYFQDWQHGLTSTTTRKTPYRHLSVPDVPL